MNNSKMVEAWQEGLIKVSDEKRVCKNNSIPKIKINKNALEEIAEVMSMNDILIHEINNWVERNNGDGYHRIIAVVNGYKADGKTDLEIAEILKEM